MNDDDLNMLALTDLSSPEALLTAERSIRGDTEGIARALVDLAREVIVLRSTLAKRADSSLSRILIEVTAERARQDAKFGADRDFPSACSDRTADPNVVYGIESEQTARQLCEDAFDNGTGTWAHILVEEVAKAIAAPDDAARRAELVQVAAVAIANIENIDRRAASK